MEPDRARFYQLLGALERGVGGCRVMGECTGRLVWPERGVYFFFEPGEVRSDLSTPRVVRVGTHAVSRGARTTLWSRLRAHRGTNAGRGNHRASVFRRHVGDALIRRSGRREEFPFWGKGSSAPRHRASEAPLEKLVSDNIRRMSVLWLTVTDDAGPASNRAYLERNAISVLTAADPPSVNWLGNHSIRQKIRESGLWNIDHLGGRCDSEFLDILTRAVDDTIRLHRAT